MHSTAKSTHLSKLRVNTKFTVDKSSTATTISPHMSISIPCIDNNPSKYANGPKLVKIVMYRSDMFVPHNFTINPVTNDVSCRIMVA